MTLDSRHLVIIERLRKLCLCNTEDYSFNEYTLMCEVQAILERRMECQNGLQSNIAVAAAKLAMPSSKLERKLSGIDQVLLTIKQHGSWKTMAIGDPETALLKLLS
jgi:Na+-transporting NADH:ubiquinone oxidoreductase subunit NqrC